jgi:ureidoglycolate dehydrogenase (NAD+)
MRSATSDQIKLFAKAVLQAAGANAASADAAAEAMLHASLHGVDTHGIRLLPWYAGSLRDGVIKGAPALTVTNPRRATAVLDADGGLGHVASYRGMDEACRLAKDCGVGLCLVINSSHFGAAGAYALAAARAGFIGFVTSNSNALVVPHGGSEAIHGTSPIALAAPNPHGEAFLLDMATSSIPWNRVLRFRTEGRDLPPDVAVDRSGQFTTDPHIAHALAPLGGHDYGYKGAGLAGLAEVLGAVLTGMRLSSEQPPEQEYLHGLGHFVLAIDPTLLMPLEAFGLRLETYFAAFARQPGTHAAGGPEWAERDRRLRLGIPIPDGLLAELGEAASNSGVEMPF